MGERLSRYGQIVCAWPPGSQLGARYCGTVVSARASSRMFNEPFQPSAASRRRTIVFSTLIRAKYLSSATTNVQGASSVDVRSTMSATACSYALHLVRLRQSSGVILKRLNGVFSRALKRFNCSALLTWSQNLQTTA